jgi:hypothetical protein
LHDAFQHALAVSAQVAIGADLARGHLRIGVVALTGGGKAIELDIARSNPAWEGKGRPLRGGLSIAASYTSTVNE